MGKKLSVMRSETQVACRGARRWPLPYFFVAVLFLFLLPQLAFKVMLQGSLPQTATIFGDNLSPTPWHWHENRLGLESFDRSLEILRCSYRRFVTPGPTLLALNDTDLHEECPSYFQWIEKDLAPWNDTGITRWNIEMAREHAAFRVVILKGRLYVDLYYSCVQTRAVFTVWGFLLLLEKYKRRIPDVEMMFECMDRPTIAKVEDGILTPPPLFRYCSNSHHYDIPWPDWSFWGWSETKLDPWDQEREKIVRGSERNDWRLKFRKAYWRGNSDVGSPVRTELLQCNGTTQYPRADVHNQNWNQELAHGKENSKLENQCNHRYKIYAEGFAWSVSFKYILACGSPTLAISPAYYDFFMRGLKQWVHYIPVRPSQICASKLCAAIENQVDYSEAHTLKAMRIGKAGQDFMRKEVGMKNVYDYMFHMIRAYAARQRFKPSIPIGAKEVTQDFILCLAQPHERLLLEKSRKQMPLTSVPCEKREMGEELHDFEWEAKDHDEHWSSQDCDAR